jgi:hypothetical protein
MRLVATNDDYDGESGEPSGLIHTSTDGGVTWTERPTAGLRSWADVASSADGMKLVAGGWGTYLSTSADGGVTWTEHTGAGLRDWITVASSADGMKLVAGVNGGYLYTSVDGGATWTEHDNLDSQYWYSVASSADGSKLIAGTDGGYLYTSTNGGTTWTEQTDLGEYYWDAIASSADGTKLVAGVWNGHLYTSSDSGATWTEHMNDESRSWNVAASSADGMTLIAGAVNGSLYVSTDGGATWIEQTRAGSKRWWGVASSADGSRMIGAAYNNYLYLQEVASVATPPSAPSSPGVATPAPSLPASTVPRIVSRPAVIPSSSVDDGVRVSQAPSPVVEKWIDVAERSDYLQGEGVTLPLRAGQGIRFRVANAPHTVTVDRIEGDRVTFTLRSTPQVASLRIGETGRYDVNEDGVPDIAVSLKSITGGVADLTFAAIATPAASTQEKQSAHRDMLPWTVAGGVVVLVVSAIFLSVIIRRRLAK